MISLIIILSLIHLHIFKIINNEDFKNLQNKINNLLETHLILDCDYIFNKDEDTKTGIIINKTMTIDGQNHIINGLNQSKIFYIYNTTLIIKDINFIYGFSKDFGGAINLINSSLEIINCTFSSNNANIYGGAIYLNNSYLNLSKSIFKFNKAEGLYSNGGGINSENSMLNVNESIFYNNSADEGGAIYCINTTLNIFDSDFYNNNANWYGGALLSDSQLLIYKSNFNNNKAGYKGGAIHTTLYNEDYIASLLLENSIMFNNDAEYGGAISSSNIEFVHIYNSEIYNNNASFGSVISRLSSNNIEIINSSCYDNNAKYGGILYSMAGGNNIFINDNFENNRASIGGLIYTISGRISSKQTNYSSKFIHCDLIDNFGKKGLIYSVFDELIIESSNITILNKSYTIPIIYKIIAGRVIENNNWWGEINPDLNKLIIYEYENITNNNNIFDNEEITEGCSSTFIQIDDDNAAFTFRRDSSTSINVNIIYQNNGILQYKSDPDYFWHAIINKDGWIVGSGGVDTPYSSEKLEAYAKIMIKENKIIDEFIDKVFRVKSMYDLGHFLIKSPNGTYGLVINIIGENIVKIEKGKINHGEYIISPNDYNYYRKGKISDLKIKENYTYISRYLAAIDEYSSVRTNDFTYNIITKDKSKYVDIFVSNDDGSLANKSNNSYLYNDINIKDKYILGEKVPIIMNGLYLDRYLISNDSRDNNGKNIRLNSYLIFLLLISLLS